MTAVTEKKIEGVYHSSITQLRFELMMLHRKSTRLAVEALLLLALEPEGACWRVRELAARLGIPATYLAKIVRELTRLNLLQGLRGPGGGVRLAGPARETSLWGVLTSLEPADEFGRCLLKLSGCDEIHPCPLHEQWAPIRAQIKEMLESKSLRDIALEAQARGTLASGGAADPARSSRDFRMEKSTAT